ncbi:MAG: protein kinase [Deltaproteobacteria bacterium]|nr:protein kinase [Deltaproteobacteria bacterium]
MRLCPTCGRLSEDGVGACPVDGHATTEFTSTLAAGEALPGGFKVVAPLGVGQSGEVYEGQEEAGGSRVVIRLLSEDMAKDKRLSDVVRRHLLKQKEFDHRYVVRIRAVETHRERILVVRDWVDGRRLEDVLRDEGPQDVVRTLDLGLRICAALAEAHKVGLLHLQLRASNVFVVPAESGEGESIRLVDFGIGPRRKIGNRPVYGQPGTLSPEQIEGKIVSFKSDMFSAGLLLYRMLAGAPPWTGDADAVVKQILESPVPPIPARPESPVPLELWTFIRQTLEKKPIHRPLGMAQMADRLKELQGDAASGRLSIELPVPSAIVAPKASERSAPIGRIALKPRAAGGGGTGSVEVSGLPGPAAPEAPVDIEIPVDDGKQATVEIAPSMLGELKAVAAQGEKTTTIDVGAVDMLEDEKRPVAAVVPKPPAAAAPAAPVEAKRAAAKAPEKPVEKPAEQPVVTMRSAGRVPEGGSGEIVLPGLAAKAREEPIQPSSATMPIDADIIEEAAIPPPMRAAKRAGSAPPAGAAAVPVDGAAAYKRGLAYGLGGGLALAVIAFFCAMFLFRGKAPACPKAPACETVASAAGPGEPRLSAAGPMEVTAVGDAGASAPAARDAEEPAVEAASEPEPDAGAPAVEAAVEPAADSGGAAADAGTAPEREVSRPAAQDAGRAPERDVVRPSGQDAARPAEEDAAQPPRPEAGGGGADNAARATELVTQGDQALGARNFSAARAAYEEALQLQPGNNRAKIGLGRVAFQEGNFEEAVRWLEPIYRNQGNMDLGAAYVRLGRLPDAKAQFEKLLERNPNNAAAQSALDAVNRQLGQ